MNQCQAVAWYCGKPFPVGEASNPGPLVHCAVANIVSLYNKSMWFDAIHDVPGVFFAAETGASEQMIKSESRQLRKNQFLMHPSQPIRPKG